MSHSVHIRLFAAVRSAHENVKFGGKSGTGRRFCQDWLLVLFLVGVCSIDGKRIITKIRHFIIRIVRYAEGGVLDGNSIPDIETVISGKHTKNTVYFQSFVCGRNKWTIIVEHDFLVLYASFNVNCHCETDENKIRKFVSLLDATTSFLFVMKEFVTHAAYTDDLSGST